MERQRRHRPDRPVRREMRERTKVPEMENLLSQLEVEFEKVDNESPNDEGLINNIISRKRGDEKTSRDRKTTTRPAGASSRMASGHRQRVNLRHATTPSEIESESLIQSPRSMWQLSETTRSSPKSSRTSPTIPNDSIFEEKTQNRPKSVVSHVSDFMSVMASMKFNSLFTEENEDTSTIYTNDSTVPDLTDPITLNALILQATEDTEGFTILTPEKYQQQKKRLDQMSKSLESLKNKLALELKVKEATLGLLGLGNDENAKTQLEASETKMNEISKDLWTVTNDLIITERIILKHLSGSLRWKVQEYAVNISNAPTLRIKPGESELKKKLNSAEVRIKELEAQARVLKSSVVRLQEPIREFANGIKKEAPKAREDCGIVKKSLVPSLSSEVEHNKLKLEFATCKAELAEVREQLSMIKESNTALQLQLEEGQNIIQTKDRKISNLLGELEETTNKLELSKSSESAVRARDRRGLRTRLRGKSETDQMNNDQLEKEKVHVNLQEKNELRKELESKKLSAADDSSLATSISKLNNAKSQSNLPNDQLKLAELQLLLEEYVGVMSTTFSFSRLFEVGNQCLEKSKSITQKLKDATQEMAILKNNYESEISEIQKQIDFKNLEIEANDVQMQRKLVDAEKFISRVPELQAVIEEQALKLNELMSLKETDLVYQQNQIEMLKIQISDLKELHEHEILSQSRDFEDKITNLLIEKADLEKCIDERISTAKSKWQEEVDAFSELEKKRLKSEFELEQLESQKRLELAEKTLVDSKKQYFREKEVLDEKVDSLEREIAELRHIEKNAIEEWNVKKQDLQSVIDKLYDIIDDKQIEISDVKKELELKSRQIFELQEIQDQRLKEQQQEFQSEFKSLENKIKELVFAQKNDEVAKATLTDSLNDYQSQIQHLKNELEAQKLVLSKEVQKSQEELDSATDQILRMQRLLKEANTDVERYRKLSDDRDNEVLILKRSMRQKEKEFTEDAISGASDSSNARKILVQKEKEIDGLKSELRSLQSDLAGLQRKLEVKDREVENAKNQMKRVDTANRDEQGEELQRLQLMLFELKTTRADLLEQLDDAQHESEMLRQELNKQRSS